MHIVICMKRIPDPEPSAIPFRIDPATWRRAEVTGLRSIMSPYDAQCFEVALRLRERLGVRIDITALSLGSAEDGQLFKQAFSWEADQGILLCDRAFDGGDGYTTGLALAAAISRLDSVNLVLAGRQAADFDQGLVGYGIAAALGWPLLPAVADVRIDGEVVAADRITVEGIETLETRLPAVVTISNEAGVPRRPSMRQIMQAGRKKPTLWTAQDIGLESRQVGATGRRLVVENVFVPAVERHCKLVSGATPSAAAEALIERLRAVRAIA